MVKDLLITSGSGSLDGGNYNYKNDEFEDSNNIKPIISIIGNGKVNIAGNNRMIIIVPDNGWKIGDIKINGKSFGNIFIYI